MFNFVRIWGPVKNFLPGLEFLRKIVIFNKPVLTKGKSNNENNFCIEIKCNIFPFLLYNIIVYESKTNKRKQNTISSIIYVIVTDSK